MKIGFFTDTYLPNVDGVVTAILTFRRELEKRNHKVFVFAAGDSDALKSNVDKRVFLYRSVPFPPYPQYKIAIFPYNSTAKARRAGIELVHSHAIASMGLAAIKTSKEMNKPLVGTFHTLVSEAAKNYVKQKWLKTVSDRLVWRAIKTFYAPFDLVTAPSETTRKMLEDHGVAGTLNVPNGVDTERFNPGIDCGVVRKMLGVGKDEKLVVIPGRLSHEKNVDVILKAVPKVLKEDEKARFMVMGSGPAEASCKQLAKRMNLGKSVVFAGFVQSFEVPFFYAAADLFATASTFETQGLAMLENMACGNSCVAADAMAIPEILKEGENGFLFTPFDSDECAEKIVKALEMPQASRKKMEKNARKTAEKYSIPACTDTLLDAYDEVID